MDSLDTHAYLMIAVFAIGYFFIVMEHVFKVDKATVALLTGISCWVIQFTYAKDANSIKYLGEHVFGISQIVFFLLGALAIVELINVHKGFAIISDSIHIQSKRKLMWVICFIAFFLSAVLDNLTTTIVMVTLLCKLIDKSEDRLLIGAGIVIAANAGGAWTPIGDVTTTMLWIGGQISTLLVMRDLFLPSVVCVLVSCFLLSFGLKGKFAVREIKEEDKKTEPYGNMVLFLGIGCLVSVPIFKVLTGLPPFMGILFGLSLLWLITDLMHKKYPERNYLRIPSVFGRIDFSGLLFFLGILLAINALETAKILDMLAHWLNNQISSIYVVTTTIGLVSAVIDNVPLVAASMSMYSLEQYPTDHPFWQLIAYCAGTGGSILIIGSAAGVVFMGLEKVDFYWYFKRVSFSALIGYFAGILAYIFII